MEKLITWRRGFYSKTYMFYSNGIQIGNLEIGVWSNKSKSVLNDQEYEFVTKGFFNKETIIIDPRSSQSIGIISYGRWRSKATIKMLNGDEYNFQFTNFWQSKWNLSKNLQFINYHGSRSKGEIVAHFPDEVIIISGLFIANYFWHKRAAAAAAS